MDGRYTRGWGGRCGICASCSITSTASKGDGCWPAAMPWSGDEADSLGRCRLHAEFRAARYDLGAKASQACGHRPRLLRRSPCRHALPRSLRRSHEGRASCPSIGTCSVASAFCPEGAAEMKDSPASWPAALPLVSVQGLGKGSSGSIDAQGAMSGNREGCPDSRHARGRRTRAHDV